MWSTGHATGSSRNGPTAGIRLRSREDRRSATIDRTRSIATSMGDLESEEFGQVQFLTSSSRNQRGRSHPMLGQRQSTRDVRRSPGRRRCETIPCRRGAMRPCCPVRSGPGGRCCG